VKVTHVSVSEGLRGCWRSEFEFALRASHDTKQRAIGPKTYRLASTRSITLKSNPASSEFSLRSQAIAETMRGVSPAEISVGVITTALSQSVFAQEELIEDLHANVP